MKCFLSQNEKPRVKHFVEQAPMILLRWQPAAIYVFFTGLLCLVSVLPTLFPTAIGTAYICVFLAMTGLSVWTWHQKPFSPKAALYLALFGTLALSFIMPYTSNDAERYLWDGAVFLSGFDPYLVAPDDPSVAHLRDIWATPPEHSKYTTLYPPGALSLFAFCTLAGPVSAIWVWKALTTLALTLSLILSYKLLALRQLTQHFYLIALSPLLLFETQIGAHVDIFSFLGIIAALWCLEKDKIILAGLIIGISATTKFLPAVIVGPYLFYLRPKQAVKLAISAASTWLGIYAIVFGFGYKPLGLLPTFFEKWRGGAPLFPILDAVKSVFSLSNRAFLIGLGTLAIGGFSLSAWLAYRRKINIALLLALSVPLLLSPVLFPWYLLALLPILALRPSWTLFLAITLVPLNYGVLNKWLSEGIWQQSSWPSYALLIGLIIGLSLDLWRPKREVKL